jgi:cytochrome c oxidase assembly factor 3
LTTSEIENQTSSKDAHGKARRSFLLLGLKYQANIHYPHRLPQSSYYDKYNRPTAALYRARQPYIVKNALTGLAIMGFAIGVCPLHHPSAVDSSTTSPLIYLSPDSFTIRAVAQDDFEDVVVPDAPATPAHAPHTSNVIQVASK